MTEQEYKDYYADLLILQYKTQRKARATVGALVSQSPAVSISVGPVQYITVGSPTINNGIVSNITAEDYLVLDTPIDMGSVEKMSIQIGFTTGSSFSHSFEGVVGGAKGAFSFYITKDGSLYGVYLDNQGTHNNKIGNVKPSTSYIATMLVENNHSILALYEEGRQIDYREFTSERQEIQGSPYFMVSVHPFTGKLNLNQFSIQLNDLEWYGVGENNYLLTDKIANGFDINTASGEQLDIIGKYIGLKRQTKGLIGNTGTNILTDEQYRTLLKLKLIKNTNFSSTSQLRAALYQEFPSSIRLFDNRNMTYTYELSYFWNDLLDIIKNEDLLPVPMGIGFVATIVPDLLELYGYSDYGGLNDNPNGYSDYTNGFKGRYLSYGDKFAGD